MNGPSGEKPYKRYRASRVKRPHVERALNEAAAASRPRTETPKAAKDGSRSKDKGSPIAKVRHDPGAGAAAGPAAKPRAPRRFLRWRYLVLLPVPFLIAIGVWGYLGYTTFDQAVHKSNLRIDKATRAALVDAGGSVLNSPTTILILGSDQRGREPARSDTIMLMRFDPKTHTVSQLSIPRDTLIDVPGRGQMKINEAYYWGGAPLAIKTIGSFTGVPVNHIMIVNFRGFPDLIDSVGGVVVDVPSDISSWYSGNITVHFKKGPQLMDGKRALIYSRLRKVDSDFFRMGRQQQVVQALEKKIARPGNLLRLPWIGKAFMKGVGTDLTTNQIIELAYLEWRAKASQQFKWVLQGTPQMIGGGSYVIVDPAVKARTVHQFLSK